MKKKILKDNSYVVFNENTIAIREDESEKVLCNEYCSEPFINPSNNKIVYISPLEWEEIGELIIYDVNKDILQKIEINEIPEQYKIKKVEWIEDNKLIMIVGFAYGTVSVGGNIYTYDIESKDYSNIFIASEREEVKNFVLKSDTVEMEIVTFDEDFNNYTTRSEQLKFREKR